MQREGLGRIQEWRDASAVCSCGQVASIVTNRGLAAK